MPTVLVPILTEEPTTTVDPTSPSMTRLQLVQRLASESGMHDVGPTSTTGQAGDSLRMVNWIDSAWINIQQRRNWSWLWEAADVTLPADTNVVAGDISPQRYITDSMYYGTSQLAYMPWRDFSPTYREIQAGTPTTWSIRPDKALVFDAAPEAELTLTVERYRNPTMLAEDDDVPALPGEFHIMIVWRALLLYGGYDEAGALYQHANKEWKDIAGQAGWWETEQITFGGPLC